MISTNLTGASAYAAIQGGLSSGAAGASASPGDSSFGSVLQGAMSGPLGTRPGSGREVRAGHDWRRQSHGRRHGGIES